MLIVRTYSPNLDKLFDAFDWNCGAFGEKETVEDDYLLVLLDNGALVLQNGTYNCGTGWEFMSFVGEQRMNGFRSWLSAQQEVRDLLKIIESGGKETEIILRQSSSQEPLVRSLLSWMESSDIIRIQNGFYYPDSSYIPTFDEDSSRPVSCNDDEIDIKDDKYSVYEYLRKINRNMIILNPDFQRNLVWKPIQKSLFIESILMNLPVPPIYLKKESDGKYIVVDGLQRTTALQQFLNNEFALDNLRSLTKLNGCRFKDLDNVQDGLTARIEDRQLYFYIMLPSVPMRIVYDIFNRINTGGTQLTRQEIRNCVFPGPATKILKEISESNEFKMSIDNGIKPLRMKDREAILRCLAYIVQPDYKTDYSGSLDLFLEKAMRLINKMNSLEIEELMRKALACFKLTRKVFGTQNFRIPTDYTRGRINLAVMETVFHCFYGINDISVTDIPAIKTSMAALLKDWDYNNAVVSSTGSISQVLTRFEKAHSILDKSIRK